MDNDDGDIWNYEGYEHVYKCTECDGDEWRILVDGNIICTNCLQEFLKEGFLAPTD